jgi:hypothetical protein
VDGGGGDGEEEPSVEPEPELEPELEPPPEGAQQPPVKPGDDDAAAASDDDDDDDADDADDADAAAAAYDDAELAPLRILCIDGGGIKGLVPALVLQELEQLCGGVAVRELFDLVVGTSTGGILALGTCVANRQVEEMAHVYEHRAAEIWTPRGGLGTKLVKAVVGKKLAMMLVEPVQYERAGLEAILKANSRYQDPDGSGSGRQMHLSEFYNEPPKVAVVANRAAGQGAARHVPYLFRSYTPREDRIDGSSQCEVWEAACATSAAPGYYEPVEIDGVLYVDGGVTNNNPVELALEQYLARA